MRSNRSTIWRRSLTAILGVAALTASSMSVTPAAGAATTLDKALVVRYDLAQSSGTTVVDTSGNGRDGTLSGDAVWQGGSLSLGGSNGHVRLPDNIMRGLTDITVSVQVNVAADQGTPYFVWG